MEQKPNTNHISEDSFESVIENFHLAFAVFPVIAAILATITGLGKTLHLGIELSLIFVTICINFYILWRKSKADKSEDLNLFYTFRTNRLLPVQSGKKESYNVRIAVIEDKDKTYFRENLQDTFKKELDFEEFLNYLITLPKLKNLDLSKQELKHHILREIKDRRLFFKPIAVETSKSYVEDFKWFSEEMGEPTAVVVVRTSEIEKESSDIYDAVNLWAFQNKNSEIPILFAKNPDIDFPEPNETAKKFIPMPDDPKSLPWRLLKRAKERGRAWRIQAKYNRALVWNISYLFLMCVYIGAIWLVAQDLKFKEKSGQYETTIIEKTNQHENARKGLSDALVTEKLFRKFTTVKDDEKLNASYWFWNNGQPTLFVTTEISHSTYILPNSKEYIIGCGYKFPNHVIEWRVDEDKKIDTSKVVVRNNYDMPIEDHGCKMKLLETSKAKVIICATFNGKNSNEDDANTVGICVFTENESNTMFNSIKNDNGKEYRNFLRNEVENYYKKYNDLVLSKEVVPLKEIENK